MTFVIHKEDFGVAYDIFEELGKDAKESEIAMKKWKDKGDRKCKIDFIVIIKK